MKRLISHPENREYLLQRFGEDPILGASGVSLFDFPIGIEVQWNADMAPRRIREVWHAPTGDRFTEYGPEDEAWARPLGLGRIEAIDEGPLFYLIDDFLLRSRYDFGSVILPMQTILNSVI